MRHGLPLQTREGLPLVDGGDRSTPTQKVHVFGDMFALQGEGYEPVTFKRPMIKWALGQPTLLLHCCCTGATLCLPA